jgi:DNA-binding beta-propeller fold protein YncE
MSPHFIRSALAPQALTWPPVFARKAACASGYGMCVALKHGLVIVSENKGDGSGGFQLHISPADGSLVGSIGRKGSGKGQFNYSYGGLCVSPDGNSVLVADSNNNRVQQVRIKDGSWVRFVGEGVLNGPEFVDCNADVIAVSETDDHRISVLSWSDGSVRAQFGRQGSGPGQLNYPRGVRLLADGRGFVVADSNNHRLCVFALSGEFVAVVGSREGLTLPQDVLECASDGSFIVANGWGHNLVRVSRAGTVVGVYGKEGSGDGKFKYPSALAVLPDGGLVVREDKHFQVFGGPRW